MSEDIRIFEIGEATAEKNESYHHTPSKIQADTLFTFTTNLDYLIPCIEKSCLYPRYCDEDIEYLNINGLKKVYIPMKCFCDINLHRINQHLDWYGYYGLAFPKEWGMNKGIQPIQYINPKSRLKEDFSTAFNQALLENKSTPGEVDNTLKSFMLHELMYYKPYDGYMKNRITEKYDLKCFTDECEWRYVPDLSKTDYEPIYYDTNIINAGIMNDISNSLANVSGISLDFDYSDLKYIIIKTMDDFVKLVRSIENLDVKSNIKNELISKIIIWDRSQEDF